MNPETLPTLTSYTALETALLTTIHLINDDKIITTEVVSFDEDIDYDTLRDFFCAGF
ncbi:hypothetical protein [Flavobacterium sp.]|uniref:hypothetical protein n=1 Tax=Flavobacterium sp. TaxID=239 RepID=UPI0025FC0632|nr:hypothetical protein [Flavobacterium sp.]